MSARPRWNNTRNVEAPVESPGHLDNKHYTHPAFGQVGVTRVSSTGTTLYGTEFQHRGFVALRISSSMLVRGLSHDRYHELDRFIEIWMSEAQWAGLLSSIGQGSGIPCTIYYVRDKGLMPDIPPRQQRDVFAEEMEKRAREAAARVRRTMDRINEVLGAGVSDKKKGLLLDELVTLERDLKHNMPFVVDSFGEHMEEVVESAKAEFNAHMQRVIQDAGITALGGTPTPPIMLTGSTEEE